jgi:class 3 adenylate cyclase
MLAAPDHSEHRHVDPPETRFASIGNDRIAYQVLGEGKPDLVDTMGLWSHLDVSWEEPSVARFLRRLAAFSRVIRFDPRGSGLSDGRPDDGRSVAEYWAEDLLTVLDTVHSKSATIYTHLDASALALLFAHAHRARCSGLVLAVPTARFLEAPDYPQGHRAAKALPLLHSLREAWGTEDFCAYFVPSQAKNDGLRRWYSKWCRAVASPKVAAENLEAMAALDVRHVLPTLSVPTLVLSRRDNPFFPTSQGRYIADTVPGARFAELPGADALMIWESADEVLDMTEEFITGKRRSGEAQRVLATVLFTDIVGSTRRAAKLGDAAWRELLDRHDRTLRQQIELFGGRLIETTGDGTLATFDSPGRAIDCAHALHEALAPLDLQIRAGLHIGELELREDGRVGGIAVHIGARVLGLARGGEVLVSRTVRDVLIGSRYKFKDRGIEELAGVPSKWPLYAVSRK